MLKEFREFALEGNMLDMAVGIIIGASFSGVVNSLVNDILMPPMGLLLGNADFSQLYVLMQAGDPAGPYASLSAAQEAGAVTLNYGMFVNTLVNFVVVAFALFAVVRSVDHVTHSVGA